MTHNTNKEECACKGNTSYDFHSKNHCCFINKCYKDSHYFELENTQKNNRIKEECTHEMQESDRFRVCKKCGVAGIGTADETKATLKLENPGSLTWNTNSPNIKLENKPKEEWEKEFDRDFYFDGVTYKGSRHWKDNVKHNLVKSFIKQTLATHHQKIVEEIEKMYILDVPGLENNEFDAESYIKGYADAKYEALSIIKSKV